jgi:3'(2'), 5'-bisphosphate nucleotidase
MSDAAAELIDLFSRLAVDAGRVIMRVRAEGVDVRLKADATPVTEADRLAEALILEGLATGVPDIPVVAEEEVCDGRCPDRTGRRFILVDALDGTREFVADRPDFTVNIALVEDGVPVAGVVHPPMRGALYAAIGGHAWKRTVDAEGGLGEPETLTCRPLPALPVVVASKSHLTAQTAAFIARISHAETVNIGSSLKFCLLAEGGADLYPRFGPTMEWDTAAGDAVLRAAGGATVTVSGEPLTYGKRDIAGMADFANPHFLSASAEGLRVFQPLELF